MDAAVAVLRFGKHKNMPVDEVPTDYLAWVVRTFRNPPAVVRHELRRRGQLSGASAILAATALSDRAFRDARRKNGRKRRPKHEGASRTATPSEAQRQVCHERSRKLARGVQIVGEHFERLRADWEAAGGNQLECPFESPSVPERNATRTLTSPSRRLAPPPSSTSPPDSS